MNPTPTFSSNGGEAQTAARTLAAWQARETELRARMHGFGSIDRAQLASMAGIDLFRALLDGKLPGAPIAETLDFILVEADVGHVVFQGRPLQRHYNPLGSVHGGWFATLLDSALGCAVHSALPAGKLYTTAELKVNMIRPLSDKVPMVRAEGHVVHVGGRMATADGRLLGPDGKLYAHGSTTCFVFDAPGAST